MPNRIIKESVCTSENVDRLSAFQETFFYRLIVNCDDYGLMDARPKVLAARLYPLKDMRVAQIEDALRALTSAELVTLYEVDGKPFLRMNTWDRHQRIRAKQSKYPHPEDCSLSDDSNSLTYDSNSRTCVSNSLSNDGLNPIQKESKKESNPKEKEKRFAPPSIRDVAEYCRERGNKVDAEAFVSFYESKGWKVGNQPMTDWKAAVITWEKREHRSGKTVNAQQYGQRSYEGKDEEMMARFVEEHGDV